MAPFIFLFRRLFFFFAGIWAPLYLFLLQLFFFSHGYSLSVPPPSSDVTSKRRTIPEDEIPSRACPSRPRYRCSVGGPLFHPRRFWHLRPSSSPGHTLFSEESTFFLLEHCVRFANPLSVFPFLVHEVDAGGFSPFAFLLPIIAPECCPSLLLYVRTSFKSGKRRDFLPAQSSTYTDAVLSFLLSFLLYP